MVGGNRLATGVAGETATWQGNNNESRTDTHGGVQRVAGDA